MATQQSSPDGESQPIDLSFTCIFEYEELQEATKFFNPSEVVGEGGFGVVYRGKLTDGRTVAVKELSVCHKKRIEQFFNEVRVLSGLYHKNLVTLYGCTNPEDEKLLLVYEFVPNGTVGYHLHSKKDYKEVLSWDKRIQIAIQTAEALVYLHSLEPPIIHCDVKSDNVLLDNNFNVKVADFGLCRLLPLDGAHISTMPHGTQGYIDPEYSQYYKLTTKSDVYSFGVFLLELISGKVVLDSDRRIDDEIWLVRMAFNKMKNKKLEQLVDLKLGYDNNMEIKRMINSVAELAYKCLQPRGYMRPRMMEVLLALKGIRDGEQRSDITLDLSDPMYSTDLSFEQASRQVQSTQYESRLLDIALTFRHDELQEVTNFISRELSHGGLKREYHGQLRDGRIVVVKILYACKQKQHRQFYNKVKVLTVPHRLNTIALYSCRTADHPELLSIYEYITHSIVPGSLPRRILAREAPSWALRMQIAIETAESLSYLHSLQPPVPHRDVQVASLELFHILPGVSTYETPQGMPRYLDLCSKLSDTSSVYSFGVFLLELVSGVEIKGNLDDGYPVRLVLEKIRSMSMEVDEVVDLALGYHSDTKRMINLVAALACKCLHPEEGRRPPITEVLRALKAIREGSQHFSETEIKQSFDEACGSSSHATRHLSVKEYKRHWRHVTGARRVTADSRQTHNVDYVTPSIPENHMPGHADPIRQRVTYAAAPPEPDDSHLYSPWFQVHLVVAGDPPLVQMPEVQAPADDLPPEDTTNEELRHRLFLAHNVIRGGRQLLLSQTRRAGDLVGSLQQELAFVRAQLDEITLRSMDYGVPLHGPFSYPGSQAYSERYQWGGGEHNIWERGESSRREQGESSRQERDG